MFSAISISSSPRFSGGGGRSKAKVGGGTMYKFIQNSLANGQTIEGMKNVANNMGDSGFPLRPFKEGGAPPPQVGRG